MRRAREKLLMRGLWGLYAVLALVGLGLLAEALFVPRSPRPFTVKLPSAEAKNPLQLQLTPQDSLVNRRFTRRVTAAAAPAGPAKPRDLSLDQLIKLTGILDFGGKQPTLAVIEATGESKAYKAGDKVGETGVVIKDIKEYVLVEFEKRRFKVTFTGIQELPANAFGKD
jgi:hypothetical protein